MKDTHFLYGISAFAVVGVLVCLIGYTTDPHRMHTPKQRTLGAATPSTTETSVKKKKNCGCCADRVRELRIKLQKAREAREARKHQQAAQQTRTPPYETMPRTPASSQKNAGLRP